MTIRSDIEYWVRPGIRALSAYAVPDPGDCIKLDAMENPYDWPDSLKAQWLERLRNVQLNRYPDPDAGAMCERIRAVMNVPAGAGLLPGNGSDELIQMIIMAVAGEGRVILAPEPAFVMYRIIAQVTGAEFRGVPLRRDTFGLDEPAMLREIQEHEPAVVFLAYPNNPTGNLFDESAVRAVIDAAPGLVVIDEAYAAFASRSFLGQTNRYPNVLILRTVSKMGLAGLRLGYLAGPPDWLEEINKTRLPYNINVLTQASVEFALEHKRVLDEQTGRICSDRGALYNALSMMDGVKAWPSEANFILFRVPEGRANAIFESLRSQGVLIKNLNGVSPVLADCLRVTVGTTEQNDAFLAALGVAL